MAKLFGIKRQRALDDAGPGSVFDGANVGQSCEQLGVQSDINHRTSVEVFVSWSAHSTSIPEFPEELMEL